MSVLSLPRLYFNGQMYWTPSTMNNNDYSPALPTYDIPQAKLNKDFLESQLVKTEEDFRKWVIKPTLAANGAGNNYITPPAEWGYYNGMQCGFVTDKKPVITNPDFGLPPGRPKTTITGFTDNTGTYQDSDAWVGCPIQLNAGMVPAKMVDVDPQMPWATQLFCDKFTLGSEEGGQGFTSPIRNRMATRYIFGHTYDVTDDLMIAGKYSVVFQNCLRKEDLVFFDKNPKPGSFQAQLQEALQEKGVLGLMIRINAYDTYYFQGEAFAGLKVGSSRNAVGEIKDPSMTADDNRTDFMNRLAVLYKQYEEELKEYKLGKRKEKPLAPINNAYSRSVGWIGLWKEGELTTTPSGRILFPYEDPQNPPPSPDSYIKVQAKDLPENYYKEQVIDNKKQVLAKMSLGTTMVEVDADADTNTINRITVDMGSTIPLHNVFGWKAEFGDVKLCVKLSEDDTQSIASLPYYRKPYIQKAGVVDLTEKHFDKDFLERLEQKKISAKDLLTKPLVLKVHSYTYAPDDPTAKNGWKSEFVPALNESQLVAETDLRGVYLNEGGSTWKPTADIQEFTVKLYHLGSQTIPDGTQLSIVQYTNPAGNLVPVSKADNSQAYFMLSYKDSSGNFEPIYNDTLIPIPASGEVLIQAKTKQTGLPVIRFFPVLPKSKFDGPLPGCAMFAAFYTAARVLPFHNKMATDFANWLSTESPNIDEVNARIFREVYGTYHMMYPDMSFINNPTKFQSWRKKILAITDDALFESARYMPVTRAMSSGQRYMLEKYVEYLGELPPPPKTDKSHFFTR